VQLNYDDTNESVSLPPFAADLATTATATNNKMKTEEKSNAPKVRIAIVGQMNVGKSGECRLKLMNF
jgi:predicted GTPase